MKLLRILMLAAVSTGVFIGTASAQVPPYVHPIAIGSAGGTGGAGSMVVIEHYGG